MLSKIDLGSDVFDAALMRIDWLFETFDQVCLSFSGGKGSSVLFHMTAAVARRKKRNLQCFLLTGKHSIP